MRMVLWLVDIFVITINKKKVMIVERITRSNYFGKISKVIWYRVTDEFNTYNVDLYVYTNQFTGSIATIQNRSSQNGIEWSENIPPNATQAVLGRQIKIMHVPTLKAREYVIINQAV